MAPLTIEIADTHLVFQSIQLLDVSNEQEYISKLDQLHQALMSAYTNGIQFVYDVTRQFNMTIRTALRTY